MGILKLALFVCLIAGTSKTTAQTPPSASSSANSNAYSAGGSANLGDQALAGFTNNNTQFQGLSTSQNSANGNSKNTISGSVSSYASSGPSDFPISTAYIQSNSGANSNGNALTGNLQNLDKTNSTGAAAAGTSQISGTGTGMSVNSNVNANAYAYIPPPTTTAPLSCTNLPCGGCACYCPPQCSYCGYAGSSPVTAVPAPIPPKAKKNKAAPRNVQSKMTERTAAAHSEKKKYLPVVRHEQRGVLRAKRSVLFVNRC